METKRKGVWPVFESVGISKSTKKIFGQWYVFVTEKYDLVGRLLKSGEEPTDYTDTEEEHGMPDHQKDDWRLVTQSRVVDPWR